MPSKSSKNSKNNKLNAALPYLNITKIVKNQYKLICCKNEVRLLQKWNRHNLKYCRHLNKIKMKKIFCCKNETNILQRSANIK